MSLADCYLIELPKITDPRGNLTFIESYKHLPFDIKRVYYLYDVPGGATRAGHAHKIDKQVLIAISGSFDVLLDDGFDKKLYHLNRSYMALYVHPLTWRVIDNFSSGAVCLSIVSELYDAADYYRDYDEFLKAVGVQKNESSFS
jgi:dTDP-4-dehydrorhamnose 3,5-epimerase-like enzyme